MNQEPGATESEDIVRQVVDRSPLLLDRRSSGLLIVDLQARLMPLIPNHDVVVWNVDRLARGAQLLGIPIVGTEQYPEKLGRTVSPVDQSIMTLVGKRSFSCGGCSELFRPLSEQGCSSLLITGVETHVCVLQSVLDLLADGFDVFVAVDSVAARHDVDHTTALHRMESAGATLTTTETALFEWCETSIAPEFKQISSLIRETGPGRAHPSTLR